MRLSLCNPGSQGDDIVLRAENKQIVIDQRTPNPPDRNQSSNNSQQANPKSETIPNSNTILGATRSAVEADIKTFKQKIIDGIHTGNSDIDPSDAARYVDRLGIQARLLTKKELEALPPDLRPKLTPELLTSKTVSVLDSGKIVFKDPSTRRTYVIGMLETADGRAVEATPGVDLGLELKKRNGTANALETIDQRTSSARESLTQGLVKEADVNSFVERFPQNQRQDVLNVLGYLGQQGSFNQFNLLRSSMGREKKVYTPGDGGLGDSFAYLANEKSSFRDLNNVGDGSVKVVSHVDQLYANTVILLDESMLRKLESDEKFRSRVVQSGAKIVRPGASLDIDPLSGVTPESLTGKVKQFLSTAEEDGADLKSPADMREVADIVLNRKPNERLKAIGIAPESVEVPYLDSTKSNSGSVAEAFNRGGNVTDAQLRKALNAQFRFDELSAPQQELLLRYVKENAEVYSPAELNQSLKQQHQKIVSRAQQAGVNPKDIIYVVPQANKSYGIVAGMYQPRTSRSALSTKRSSIAA